MKSKLVKKIYLGTLMCQINVRRPCTFIWHIRVGHLYKNSCTLPSLFLQCHHTSTFFNSNYWLKFKTNKHISVHDQVGKHNPLFHLRHDLSLLPLKRFIFFPLLLVIKIVLTCLSEVSANEQGIFLNSL